jgi:hypothetical protein
MGQYANAIEQYQDERFAPASYGDLLRARWLKDLAAAERPKEEAEKH